MIEFTTLASSSAGNAYVLTDGRSRLLMECGLPWQAIREAMRFRTSDLAGILVSHEHGDHAKGVAGAIRAGMDVYASDGTFDALGVTGHRRHDLAPRVSVRIGSWTVLPFEAVHDAAAPLGFLLASRAGKVLFLTDSAYCRYRFCGLTHIMIECNNSVGVMRRRVESGELAVERKRRLLNSHMSLERLQEMLAANDLSTVREIHLLHLSDDNSDAEMFRNAIQRQTGKPVYVAQR